MKESPLHWVKLRNVVHTRPDGRSPIDHVQLCFSFPVGTLIGHRTREGKVEFMKVEDLRFLDEVAVNFTTLPGEQEVEF